MNYVTISEVIRFHQKIIEQTGGSNGIRDKSLIESALHRPFMTFDGKELYDTPVRKIATTTYSLIQNHAFIDGNKRIGVSIMILLLRINDIKINYSQKELIGLGLGIASGEQNEQHITDWIKGHREI